ncbi:phage late control D family protein [Thermoleptolyngbya sp. M55_K2018_002]|uniref:phage late control D family protein n=1 Tax=Thermoleptolyngbya sp. M55_K2018_002 TaxID=2747808 RepID=UPI0019DF5B64|nr:contractile injection system protein, VgrG/Pvc8 family [Thermoleptolyngbya sp. M55_K2018_002]HIK42151.1 phage protein D [Thermoleptolyngbya sp. M55_K2018_002]
MVRYPTFSLTYEGKDITEDIKPYVLAIAYTDKLEGESDELEITLENLDLRWMNAWYPKPGDRVTLRIGYLGEALIGSSFEVDEPEFTGAPDTLRLKGLATPVTAALRQKNTTAYGNTTLRAIARRIADKHKLQLVGNVPEIRLERVTQKEETDLEFLRKLSADYGLIFKVEGTEKLVFFKESDLEAAAAAIALDRKDLARYSLKRGTAGTYKSAEISYQDPKTGRFISAKVDAQGKEVAKAKEDAPAAGDVLKIRERCENREQAIAKATEQLRRANKGQIEGNLDIEGNVRLNAGSNLTLTGFFGLNGKYQIEQVRHTLTRREGYKSSAEIKGIEVEGQRE